MKKKRFKSNSTCSCISQFSHKPPIIYKMELFRNQLNSEKSLMWQNNCMHLARPFQTTLLISVSMNETLYKPFFPFVSLNNVLFMIENIR